MNKTNKLLSDIVAFRTYAKYLPHLGRRETLAETINRNMAMHLDRFPKLSKEILKAFKQIHELKVMPSMRSMQFGGEAILKNQTRTFNCSFVHAKYERVFAEILYLLLCGTGVGFSVQKRHTSQLPKIQQPKEENVYRVHDSIEGWAEALNALMGSYFYRSIRPVFDFSQIRAKGSYLVTTGAKAPGPEPLKAMLAQVEERLKKAVGRRMTPLEVHDLICITADCVLAGGIRRAALISLFDRDDSEMLSAKAGEWWVKHPYRARANNSVVLPRQAVTKEEFRAVFDACIASNAGEPGFFWTNEEGDWGANPCCEISLQSNQFCNLSTTNLTDIESDKDLHNRVSAAAFLGTLQASYTDFPYLSEKWKTVTEEESLLGCSLTGVADSANTVSATTLREMAKLAVEVNQTYAKKIGINPAARVSCVKPEGCRPWDGLVTTNEGVFTLQELFEDHPFGTDWSLIKKAFVATGNGNRLTKTFANGEAEVFSVELSGGISVESTSNHQWFIRGNKDSYSRETTVIEKFVQTKDLKPGDLFDLSLGLYKNEQHTKLLSVNLFQHNMSVKRFQDIVFPEEMSEDLAWLLGYLWADGCITSNNRLKFFEENEAVIAKIKEVVKKLFNLEINFLKAKNKNMFEGSVGSVALTSWLHKNGIEKYAQDSVAFIPTVIRTSHWKDLVAFFAGFADGDGCVRKDKKSEELPYLQLTLTQKASIFTKHLQDVGMTVGLAFGRSLNTKRKSFGTNPIHLMHLMSHTIPESAHVLAQNMVKARSNPKPLINSQICPSPKHILGKVTAIHSLGVLPTYDVEVENEHWFYAGAVKSHNSASCVVGSSSGIHARHSDYYLRRVRMNKDDTLARFLKSEVPELLEDDLFSSTGVVLTVPQESPEGAIIRSKETAKTLFNRVSSYYRNWIKPGHVSGVNTHNVSCTINYLPQEVPELFDLLWDHRENYTGLSLLPFDAGTYQQAPFEDCTKEIFEKYSSMTKDLDLTKVIELEDHTDRIGELACAGGSCEVDFVKGKPKT